MSTLIDIEHLDKYYGNFQALSDINLQVEEGEVTGEPSGDGAAGARAVGERGRGGGAGRGGRGARERHPGARGAD